MTAKKIIENAERARREYDAQTVNNSLQRLPKRGGSRHCTQHDQDHGREREKHIEGNGLRQRDAAWYNAKDRSIETTQKR